MPHLLSARPPRHARYRRPAGAALAVALTLAGCGPPAPVEVTVQDSAGVRVVVSSLRADTLPVALRLGGAPLVDFARRDPEAVPFAFVTDAVLLDDGGAVALTADGSVHGFGAEGDHRWSRALSAVALAHGPGDSVTVLTEPGTGLQVLGADGEGRRLSLSWAGPAPLSGVFPSDDGWWALTGWSTAMVPPGAGPGLREDPALVVRFHGDGRLRDTLATVPGSQVGLASIAGRMALVPPYLPRLTLAAGRRGEMVVGTGVDDGFRVWSGDGELRMVARRAGRDLGLTAPERARLREHRQRLVGQNPLTRSLADELERLLPMPERRPPYVRLLMDGHGRVWAAEYPLPGETPRDWAVFDEGGSLLGRVRFPEGFLLLDVGRDRVLGQVRLPGGATLRIFEAGPPA